MLRIIVICGILASLAPLHAAWASDTPQEARQELMEDVGEAAKPIGKVLKGEQEFDADVAMESFRTWSHAAGIFGDLFPEGSESGFDTEARDTIWSDREGFNANLTAFAEAVDQAIEAAPQDLGALEAAAGPVFKKCKGCHEDYRLEDED